MPKLFITTEHITAYSGFDGNIDNDSISPFIFMAQNAEIKRILGDELYTKIESDLSGDTLAGDYLALYNNYIVIIHSYFTCSLYLQLGVVKTSQNGAYFITPEKTQLPETDYLKDQAAKYDKLAVGLELEMIKYLDGLNLPERPAPSTIKAKSNFNWIKV